MFSFSHSITTLSLLFPRSAQALLALIEMIYRAQPLKLNYVLDKMCEFSFQISFVFIFFF